MALNPPLKYYCDETAFRFHILDVGEGLMILIIFPDNKVMLFDCNVTEENADEILNYLDKNIPLNYNEDTDSEEKIIHFFVNSHRDDDHCRGLKKVNEKFKIKSIWDSGQTGASTQSDTYKYYMYLRRKLRDEDADNLKELVPTDLPIANIGGANIYCLSSKEEYQEGYDNCVKIFEAYAKIQHTNSIVLKIEYANTSMLLTGDSDWKCWKEKIIPTYGSDVESNILIASHHGSRSFFTDEEQNDSIDIVKSPDTTYIESIDYINPDVVLISCGDYKTQHHPNKEALKIYLENCENQQVYTTKNCGHIVGYIDSEGNYTVVPSRFCETRTASITYDMQINCTYTHNNTTIPVKSGSTLDVGGTLKFSLSSKLGFFEPIDRINTWWEVSNGGKGVDSSHQEIYYKGKNENDGIFSFKRDLTYVGTHLLRCRVYNPKKGTITKIFCINGK